MTNATAVFSLIIFNASLTFCVSMLFVYNALYVESEANSIQLLFSA